MQAEVQSTDRLLLERFRESFPEFQSVGQIAALPQEEFVGRFAETFAGDARQLRRIHQYAAQVEEKAALIWANIKDVASPYLQQTLFNNVPPEFLEHLQAIPDYDRLFGSLDFIECDHARSIFGPAAYFVDLMRLVETHITRRMPTSAAALKLEKRRPDLAHIQLNKNNTYELVPYIDLVLEVLEAVLRTKEDPDAYRLVETAGFPMNLPFNLPLAEIRLYLQQLKTDLHQVYQTFATAQTSRQHLDREYLGFSPREYDLVANSSADQTSLATLYDLPRYQLTDRAIGELMQALNVQWERENKPQAERRAAASDLLRILGGIKDRQYRKSSREPGAASAHDAFLAALHWLDGYARIEEYEPSILQFGQERLSNVRFFLEQTGLSRRELNELIYQDLDRHEINAGLSRLFFINNVDDGLEHLMIEQDPARPNHPGYDSETLINLSFQKLDAIYRFLKLARQLEWSFADLDWALRSLSPSYWPEQALKFDGRNDFIACQGVVSLLNSAFTVEAWINPVIRAINPIICQGDAAGQKEHAIDFLLWLDGDGRLAYYDQALLNQGADAYLRTEQRLPDGEFSHVAITVTAGGVTFYVNGQLSPAARTGQPPAATAGTGTALAANLNIGRNLGDSYFEGIIKEVRLWRVVRTQSQIADNRYRRFSGREPGLEGYWPLVPGHDNRLLDLSSHANHGQMGGDGLVTQPTWVRRDLVLDPLPRLQGYQFAGIDQYLGVHGVSGMDQALPALTLEAWVRLDQLGENPILCKGSQVSGQTQFLFGVDAAGRVTFGSSSLGTESYQSQTAVVVQELTHVAIAFSGQQITFYLNGVENGSVTLSNQASLSARGDTLRIGRDFGRQYFTGLISEVRIWEESRTSQQLLQWMYRPLRQAEQPALIGAWRLDEVEEGSATENGRPVAFDHSPNHNHLYLGGVLEDYMPAWTSLADLAPGAVATQGTVLQFDGENDIIILENGGNVGLGRYERWTLELWFKANAAGRSDRKQVLYTQGDAEAGLNVYLAGGRIIVLAWNAEYGPVAVRETALQRDGIESDRWYHLAVTNDESQSLEDINFKAYLDGELFAESSAGFALSPVGPAYLGGIGRSPGETRFEGEYVDRLTNHHRHYFAGQITDLRLWHEAKTLAEIDAGRVAAPNVAAANLLSYLPLDEGSGPIIRDQAAGIVLGVPQEQRGRLQQRNVALAGDDHGFPLENCFAHYAPPDQDSSSWQNYTFSGRLQWSDSDGGIGLTLYSGYPQGRACFYQLRRHHLEPAFYLDAYPGGVLSLSGGKATSGILPQVNTWYRFRIEMNNQPDAGPFGRTQIRAKIWLDGSAEPADYNIDAFDDGPNRLTGGTVGLWAYGPGQKRFDDLAIWQADQSVYLLEESFEAYEGGQSPASWRPTGVRVYHQEEADLFRIGRLETQMTFGTDASLEDIHAHYHPGTGEIKLEDWNRYEYRGRMLMEDEAGGVGVTFFSHFPQGRAQYYLLRSQARRRNFHLSSYPLDRVKLSGGNTKSAVVPLANTWYRFCIQVEYAAGVKGSRAQTLIRAKIWQDGTPEPDAFEIDAYDSSRPLVYGGVGLWAAGAGTRYFADMKVVTLVSSKTETPQELLVTDFTAYQEGETPAGWVSTGPNESLQEQPGLFRVLGWGNRVLGPGTHLAQPTGNLHTHFQPSGVDVLAWQNYTYSGRLYVNDESSGIGVTFYSRYPEGQDQYYRLRRYWDRSGFHLDAHPDNFFPLKGETAAAEIPTQTKSWYRFQVEVSSVGGDGQDRYTRIRAKVWPDGTPAPQGYQIEAIDDSPSQLTSGAVGLWAEGDVTNCADDLQVWHELLLDEDFSLHREGQSPNHWQDTGEHFALAKASGLFTIRPQDDDLVLGTESSLADVHSHFNPPAVPIIDLNRYTYSGRLWFGDEASGIGVTFFSHYPDEAYYYCLRRAPEPGSPFELSSYPRTGSGSRRISNVTRDAQIRLAPGTWYRFRIDVVHEPERRRWHDDDDDDDDDDDVRAATLIRVKVWPDGDAEPADTQYEAEDQGNPIPFGTVGIWTSGEGLKSFDDLKLSRRELLPEGSFEATAVDQKPAAWRDTASRSPFQEDASLFKTQETAANLPRWQHIDDYPLWLNPTVLGFDGQQHYLAASGVVATDPAQYTIEAWVQPARRKPNAAKSPYPILSQGDSLKRRPGFWFGLDGDRRPALIRLIPGQPAIEANGTAALKTDRFTHVAVAVAATTVTFYVDGEPDPGGPQSLTMPVLLEGPDSEIGRDIAGQHFDGHMQEVRLWQGCREAAQIRAGLYQGARRLLGQPDNDLIALWPFLEGAGPLAQDVTAGGHHQRLGGLLSARFPRRFDSPFWVEKGFWRPERQVLRFDRPEHALRLWTDLPAETRQRRTVEVWFRVEDATIANRKQVIYHEGDGQRGLLIYLFAGRLYFGGYGRPAWSGGWIQTRRVQSGRWHHATLVLDGRTELRPGSLLAYLDGKPVGDCPAAQLNEHRPQMILGAAADSAQFHDGAGAAGAPGESHWFRGQMLDLRVWDTVRTWHQLSEHREDERIDPAASDLVMWLQFAGDGSAGSLPDLVDGRASLTIDDLARLGTLGEPPWYPMPRVILDGETLQGVAQIKKLLQRHKLTMDRLTSLWHPIKHVGRQDRRTLFDQIFNGQATAAESWHPYLEAIPWDVAGRENRQQDRTIRSRLMSSLQLTDGDLNLLVATVSGSGTAEVLLDHDYLNHLYRLVQIPRLLRLSLPEMGRLMRLTNLPAVTSATSLVQLSDQITRLRQMGLSVSMLDFLANDVQSRQVSLPFGEAELRTLAEELERESKSFLASSELFLSDEVDQLQAGRVYDGLRHLGIIDARGVVIPAYARLADLSRLAQDPGWQADLQALVAELGWQAAPGPDQVAGERRLETIQERIGSTLLRLRSAYDQSVLIALSTLLAVEPDLLQVLIRQMEAEMPPDRLLEALLSNRPGQTLPAQLVDIPGGYLYRLHKLLLLADLFQLDAAELDRLLAAGELFGVQNPMNPDLPALENLYNYREIREALGDDGAKLSGWFGQAPAYSRLLEAAQRHLVLDTLAELTGWDRQQLDRLVAHFGPTEDYNRPAGLGKLKAAFDLIQSMGVDADFLIRLANAQNLDFAFYRHQADLLLNVLRSRYDEKLWPRVYGPIQAMLALKRRDALLSLAMVEISTGFAGRRDPDLLYEYLLIDVQTGSEVQASRIQQAIASVQLYVQRCLMNLEKGVRPEWIPADQWEWMKNYRVWEANRKVFLYPENYIEPELRDTKTPLFAELEQELMQREISQASVEQAYINYLDKFREIANLRIVGSYLHRENDPADGSARDSLRQTLYLVGCSNTQPATYYYREHVKTDRGERWLPWKKIELTINAEFVTPVFAFNKLFLFWPEFVKLKKSVERRISQSVLGRYGVDFLNKVFTAPVSQGEIDQLLSELRQVEDSLRAFAHGGWWWFAVAHWWPVIDQARRQVTEKVNLRNRQQAARSALALELSGDDLRKLDEKRWHIDQQGFLINNDTGEKVQRTLDVYNTTIKYSYFNFSKGWIQPQIYASLENELEEGTYRLPQWQRLYAQQALQLTSQRPDGTLEPQLERNVKVLQIDEQTDIQLDIPDIEMDSLTWSFWTRFENRLPAELGGWTFTFDSIPKKAKELIDRALQAGSGTMTEKERQVVGPALADQQPSPVTAESLAKSTTLVDYASGALRITAQNIVTALPGRIARESAAIDAAAQSSAALAHANAGRFAEAAGTAGQAKAFAGQAGFYQADKVKALAETAEENAGEAVRAADKSTQAAAALAAEESKQKPDADRLKELREAVRTAEKEAADAAEAARKAAGTANEAAQVARVIEQLQAKWRSDQMQITVQAGDQKETMTVPITFNSWHHLALTMSANGRGYAANLYHYRAGDTSTTGTAGAFTTGRLPAKGTLLIGQQDAGVSDIFQGQMSEFRLWQEAWDKDRIVSQRNQRQTGQEPGLFHLPLSVAPAGSTAAVVVAPDLTFSLPPVRLNRERVILIYGHGDTVKSIRNNLEEQKFNLELREASGTRTFDVKLSREAGSAIDSPIAMLHLTTTDRLSFRDFASGDRRLIVRAPLNTGATDSEKRDFLIHRLQEAESTFMDVNNQPGWYILDTGDEAFLVKTLVAGAPGKTIPVPTTRERLYLNYNDQADNEVGQPQALSISFLPLRGDPLAASSSKPKYQFERLSTYAVHELSQNLFKGGIDSLLILDSQRAEEVNFWKTYDPSPALVPPDRNQLSHTIDFGGAHGLYYQEIFFHIPFLIANQLNAHQQFADAQRWYHYLFDPTSQEAAGADGQGDKDRYWRYLPFRNFDRTETLVQMLADANALAEYHEDPFDPHAIARLRLFAYQKAVVMKYIDNLLDWGDSLFSQDTRESINEAIALYVMAYNLLGPRPKAKPVREFAEMADYAQLKQSYPQHAVPEFLLALDIGAGGSAQAAVTPNNQIITNFCLVENERFAGYWDRVADRLYKIRHSLNIEGVFRQLALFEPPIEPADLVRAVAGGRSLGAALAALSVPVPHYRYAFMLDKAKEMVSNVNSLGAALQSALESRDAEQLASLQNTHERDIINLTTRVMELEWEEADEAITALKISKQSIEQQKSRLDRLIEQNLSPEEIAELVLIGVAQIAKSTAMVAKGVSAAAYVVPQFTVGAAGISSPVLLTESGGRSAGEVSAAIGEIAEFLSDILGTAATMTGKIGEYKRRKAGWEHERNMAAYNLQEIEVQIIMAELKRKMVERQLDSHLKTLEHNQQISDFYRSKFSNQALYSWMIGRLSGLYFQAYQLAYDMAKSAEKALQYELPSTESYISFGHWDSLKKGLLAGESLMLELSRMEKSQLDQDSRFLEIEKTISMKQMMPGSLLSLITNGACDFQLTEALFDRDFPGHYFRVIKTMAISVKVPVQPYQSLNATLIQVGSKALLAPDASGVRYLMGDEGVSQPDSNVLRTNWRANQQIAISKPEEDLGMFALDFFFDDRYFPFEGTGAVSSWRLEMPKSSNPQLDYGTIEDVIVHLRYTAKSDSGEFKQQVAALIEALDGAG